MRNTFKSPHAEKHKSHRASWLRAAVLGMNDGIVSTSSLMLGVLGASQNNTAILTAGLAGLFAGALSMAAGEFVSVSSQRDAQRADIAIEEKSLAQHPEEELAELTWIYEQRGVEHNLAAEVAKQLQAHDAVDAHARDELSIDSTAPYSPTQAAIASATAFAIGALIPIVALLIPVANKGMSITIISLVALAVSGYVSAVIGGGKKIIAALRVFVGGGIAMTITYAIGHLIGGI
jgi:vacuolar iron transporter family protein